MAGTHCIAPLKDIFLSIEKYFLTATTGLNCKNHCKDSQLIREIVNSFAKQGELQQERVAVPPLFPLAGRFILDIFDSITNLKDREVFHDV
jgi:hypothetical protein